MDDVLSEIINKNNLHDVNSNESINISCPICGLNIKTSIRAIRKTLKKKNYYKCGKCIANSPEGKAQRSKQSLKAWGQEEFRNKLTKISQTVANTEEGRKQRSKQSKDAWNREEYSKFQTQRLGDMFKSEKHRKLVSDRNKKEFESNPDLYLESRMKNIRSREALESHRKALASPEYRETHRELAKKRFENPEYKKKIAKSFESLPRGMKSNPEKAIESILKANGIESIYNKALGPYNFDFYIEEHDLFIEVQGEYWHNLENNKTRDRSKYTYFRNSRPNSKLLYIWDYDINTGIAERKILEIIGKNKFEVFNFDLSSLRIEKIIDTKEAKKFFNSWHYAQFGKAQKFLVGAYLENEIVAMAKFGPVSRKEIATSIGQNPNNTSELDRFCIHPSWNKKNLASFFLSRAENIFFQENPQTQFIVSFADSTFGHTGSIYKACNWKQVGVVKPDYVYTDKNGWMMHKKTLYNNAHSAHMKEAEWANIHGWKKVFGKEKYKFVKERKTREDR